MLTVVSSHGLNTTLARSYRIQDDDCMFDIKKYNDNDASLGLQNALANRKPQTANRGLGVDCWVQIMTIQLQTFIHDARRTPVGLDTWLIPLIASDTIPNNGSSIQQPTCRSSLNTLSDCTKVGILGCLRPVSQNSRSSGEDDLPPRWSRSASPRACHRRLYWCRHIQYLHIPTCPHHHTPANTTAAPEGCLGPCRRIWVDT